MALPIDYLFDVTSNTEIDMSPSGFGVRRQVTMQGGGAGGPPGDTAQDIRILVFFPKTSDSANYPVGTTLKLTIATP